MELNEIAAFALVLIAQRLRADKAIPNVAVWPLVLVAAGALFWFKEAEAGWAVFASKVWWQGVVVWSFAVLGASRAGADFGLLPKTDSK